MNVSFVMSEAQVKLFPLYFHGFTFRPLGV